MFKLIGITLILAVIQISESAPVYQFLPPREGYVPVYIRLGDTPLDEINPDLALAFHESNIETRNAIDLEEQMQNDGPINDDLSESVEDVKDKISIPKDSNSEEDQKPETPVKSSDNEPDSDDRIEPQQKQNLATDNKSAEETQSEEEPVSAHLTKGNDSEEIVEPSSTTTTNKATSDDSSSEEVTKSKRNVTVPPPPTQTKEDNSSEEIDDKLTEKKANTSNESKSSEEVENKS